MPSVNRFICHNCSKKFQTLKATIRHRNTKCKKENNERYIKIIKFLKTTNSKVCNYYCGYQGMGIKIHRLEQHNIKRKHYKCHVCDNMLKKR